MSHRDKCIVLDLDETLIHSFFTSPLPASEGLQYKLDPSIGGRLYRLDIKFDDGTYGSYWALKRPHLDTFLRYIFDNFGIVVVWTAGVKEYAHAVCEWLFANQYPDAVYDRSFCVKLDNDKYTKPLLKLSTQPELRGKVRLDNTIIIDDNPNSIAMNVENAINIPAFKPNPNIVDIMDERDDCLLKIIQWFETMRDDTDVRKLDKSAGTIFISHMKTSSPVTPPYMNIAEYNIFV